MKNFFRIFCKFLVIILFLLCEGLFKANASDLQELKQLGLQSKETFIKPNEKKLNLISGQIIVKFRDSVIEPVEHIINLKKSFKDATLSQSDSLDKLFLKYSVSRARPMFRPENKDGKVTISQLKKLEKSRVENIKNKFFRRTKRAPVAQSLPELSHIYMLNLDKGIDIQQAVKDFMADPNVEWAQANYPVSTHFIPDDPSYSSQWNLQKLQMEKAWDISQGEGIVVAVVDTGVDYTHPDLVNNIWLNPGEFPGVDDHGDGVITLPELIAHGLTDTNRDGKIDLADLFGSKFEDGIDHDGDGYINDFMGYDFTHCTQFSAGAPGDNGTLNGCVIPKEPGNNPMDRFPHGTHVAGIIAAQGNNATGIIGVAPKARIMPVKTISDFAERSFNGTFADAAEGLVYAARHGADVINNSWGPGYANGSEPLTEEAVRYAYGLGAVVVFSSGNDSDDVSAYSPDNMPEVIKVAATDEQDEAKS